MRLVEKSPPNDERSTPMGLLCGPDDSGWFFVADWRSRARSDGRALGGIAVVGAALEVVPCIGHRSRQLAGANQMGC